MNTRSMKKRPSFRLWASLSLAMLMVQFAPQGEAHGDSADSAGTLARRWRQPVALAIGDDGKMLFVANRQSGSLSIIDTATRRVLAEHDVGRGLSDLAILPGGRHLLAVDRATNEVLAIADRDRSIRVVDRMKVSPDPVHVVITADGSSCVVCSLWSRRLTFINVAKRVTPDEHPALTIGGSLDLPFCPRRMAMARDGSSVVAADAFGGRLAVVDVRRRAINSVRTLPAHNIGGLAFSPDGQTLVMTHQVLNRLAQTSFDDVHWGLLIRNHLRVVRTETLSSSVSDSSLVAGSRLFDLGDVGYAAGDPADVAFDTRGNLIVALAGVDEVAISASPDQSPRRIAVGRRPTAVAPSPDGSSSMSPTRSTTRSQSSISRRARISRRSAWDRSPIPPRPIGASGCSLAPSWLTTAG